MLEDLGYGADMEMFRLEQKLDSLGVGRVIAEHRERYEIKTARGEFEAEVIGNLRFTARGRNIIYKIRLFRTGDTCTDVGFRRHGKDNVLRTMIHI